MTMDTVLWARVRELVADALALPSGEREDFVTARTALEPDARKEALALLEEELRAERLFPAGPGQAHSPQPVPPCAGMEVDRWRLVRPLGEGGMGTVWLARRTDGAFEQQVALKLLHLPLFSHSARRRFQVEQRALSRLEHPGITRLIDGGVTAGGLAFLALECVEGERIDRWCDGRRLDLRARARLFLQVCEAVHHAHRHLVVHRDLKPSNVLVDGAGRVRLLDFGIARLLDPEEDLEATRSRHGALTPRYASPEQVRGEPVSTASDVYSLGVLLYELLTGRMPYDVPTGTPTEIERAVCQSRPDRPSTVVLGSRERASELAARRGTAPARLSRALSGDLDVIVLRALAKEPQRRYSTAGELGEDLGRWLARLPVRARADTLGYRAASFVNRNRLAVGSAALVVLALIVGWVATAVQYRAARAAQARESTQRELADERFRQAQELVRTLVYGVHDRIARLPGATPARLFLIERTGAHLEALVAPGGVPASLLDDVAATYMRLGEVQGARTVGSVGDVAGGVASTRAALDLLRAALELEPADARRLDACAHAERQLADLLRLSGRPQEALSGYARQRELAERLLELAPEGREGLRQLAVSLAQAARVQLEHGRPDESLPGLARAIEVTEGLLQDAPEDLLLRRDLMLYRNGRGAALLALGRTTDALAEQRAALALAESHAAAHPDDGSLLTSRVQALLFVAETEHEAGEMDACGRHLDEALALAQEQVRSDPLNTYASGFLVRAHELLGGRWLTLGRVDVARAAFEAGLETARSRHGQAIGDREARRDHARLALKSADVALRLGDAGVACERYDEALELLGDPAGQEAAPAELEVRFAAELGLVDIAQHAGDLAAVRTGLERLLERAGADELRFPQAPWPLRNRGLVAWRLGSMLELEGSGEATRDERIGSLRRARELYQQGLDLALRMQARSWLTPLEQDVPAAFRADVERCDGELAQLGIAPGS